MYAPLAARPDVCYSLLVHDASSDTVTYPPAARRVSALALLAAVAGSVLAGCGFLTREIVRPVHAVWSGDELLVVEARYETWRPGAPYYADTAATGHEIHLTILPEGDAARAGATAVIAEDFTAGGSIEYAPLSWDAGSGIIAVGDWSGPYLLLRDGAGWRRVALAPPPELTDLLDFAVGVDALVPLDTMLAPDAASVAVIWEFTYQPGDLFYELYHNYLLAVYDADGAFRFARRLSEQPPGGDRAVQAGPWPIDLTITPHRPYPLETDAVVYNRLIWSSDSTRVLVVEPFEPFAVSLAVEASTDPPPLPQEINLVPARPLPTDSGPVRSDGLAARIVHSGNESVWTLEQLAGWEPFGAGGSVPLEAGVYESRKESR